MEKLGFKAVSGLANVLARTETLIDNPSLLLARTMAVIQQAPSSAARDEKTTLNISVSSISEEFIGVTFEAFKFAGQQDTLTFGLPESAPFPLALRVQDTHTIPQAVEAIKRFTQSGQLESLTEKHGGAILFRGLPLKTPSDYSKVAHAFGLRPHHEVGRPPLRTVLAPNVKTANEGPPELPIWPHNEYGWSTINPAWLTFSALKVPNEGGATPIGSSILIAHKLKQLAPTFYDDLKRLGGKYVYRYTVNTLVSNTGTSVRGAYGQHVKDEDDEETFRAKVEAEVRRHSDRFEWHEDGSLSVTHIVPGTCPLAI